VHQDNFLSEPVPQVTTPDTLTTALSSI